jgi:tripeptidyl-peptidase-1
MRVTSYTAGLWLLAAIASARVVPDSHVLHEERDEALGSRLVKRERFPQAQRLPMRVGLKQNNLDHAEQYLMEVSHPLSEKYGQHWTQEEIVEAFRPSQESVDLVASWLEESGIGKHRISHSDNKLWLAFDATTEEAENLLYAEFHQYENTKGHMMVGTDKYYIPEYLRNHIDYVTPGVKRTTIGRTRNAKRATGREGPRRHPAPYMPKNNTDLATCDRAITPACIRALYHFDTLNPHASVSPKNSMGIYESGDFYAQEDLNSFFTNFTSYIKNGTHPILDSVDGGVAPAPLEDAGGESNLDFMLAVGFSRVAQRCGALHADCDSTRSFILKPLRCSRSTMPTTPLVRMRMRSAGLTPSSMQSMDRTARTRHIARRATIRYVSTVLQDL